MDFSLNFSIMAKLNFAARMAAPDMDFSLFIFLRDTRIYYIAFAQPSLSEASYDECGTKN